MAKITNPGFVVSAGTEEILTAQGYDIDVAWGGGDRPWFPWQERVLQCTADEIGLFAGKSSGKSVLLRGWLVSGNPHLPDYDQDGNSLPFNQSYVNHPDYYGLILRKNEKDLQFFLREASRMWETIGGVWKNGHFSFPSGARIDAGHMADENSWHKYIGNEYQRVAIDEAALIPDYGPIEELRSCMRTPHENILRIQTMYASNCGGPGTSWIMQRFMEVKDSEGNLIPHDTIIKVKVKHPFRDEYRDQTRIWVFSTIEDNLVMKETWYAADLANLQDPKRKRAYFYGLWDAFFGSYFVDLFRPNGPIVANDEPITANHVISAGSIKLEDWWHRSISMDWGYKHESAIYWGCQEPNGRLIIYRELVASQASPERLGYEIALASRDELEKSNTKSMVLHLSHDAFATKAGGRSYAELVYAGLVRVLGPKAVHMPDVMIDNIIKAYDQDSNYTVEDIKKRESAIDAVKSQKRIGITIKKADKINTIGWQHMRELMRFRHIGISNVEFNEQKHHELLMIDPRAASDYVRFYKDKRQEKLPKLQIFDCCPILIKAIPKAQHEDGTENVDRKHFDGKDSVDSFHYLVVGIRDEDPAIPKQHYLMQEMNKLDSIYPNLDLNSRVHVSRALEEEWKQRNKSMSPFTPIMGPVSLRKAQRKRVDMLQYEFKA